MNTDTFVLGFIPFFVFNGSTLFLMLSTAAKKLDNFLIVAFYFLIASISANFILAKNGVGFLITEIVWSSIIFCFDRFILSKFIDEKIKVPGIDREAMITTSNIIIIHTLLRMMITFFTFNSIN